MVWMMLDSARRRTAFSGMLRKMSTVGPLDRQVECDAETWACDSKQKR